MHQDRPFYLLFPVEVPQHPVDSPGFAGLERRIELPIADDSALQYVDPLRPRFARGQSPERHVPARPLLSHVSVRVSAAPAAFSPFDILHESSHSFGTIPNSAQRSTAQYLICQVLLVVF